MTSWTVLTIDGVLHPIMFFATTLKSIAFPSAKEYGEAVRTMYGTLHDRLLTTDCREPSQDGEEL